MRKGFTLVEILLVVCLLAILIAMANPRYSSSYKRMILRQNAELILAQLKYAIKMAVLTDQTIKLSFEEKEKSFFLSGTKGEDFQKKIRLNPKGKQRIQSNLEVDCKPEVIEIFPLGYTVPFNIILDDKETKIEIKCERLFDDILIEEENI